MNKKILFVASGKSFHASRWANALQEKGYEVHYVSVIKLSRPLNEKIHFYHLSHGESYLKYFFAVPKLRKIIKTIQPDLVHAHYSSGNGLLAALSVVGGNIPFVTSLYGTEVFEFPNKSILHKSVLGFVSKTAREVLSTSYVMAAEYKKLYPDLNKPTITPFGVDVNKFKPIGNGRIHGSEICIGIVKKLEWKYGVDILIKAAKIILERNSKSIKFEILGGGSQEDNLKKMAYDLGISNHIKFIGWIENNQVPRYINNFDVFVVPSRCNESFGVAAVEAQACGVPVIVSDIGGLPEVIENGVTGLTVPPNDPDALACAIERLVLFPEEISLKGKLGRERVLKLYNWDDSVKNIEAVYRRAFNAS